MTGFPQKKPDIRQHRKVKEQELGNSGFFFTNPSSNTFCNKRETTQRDGLESMEQSMKSLSDSHEEFHKGQ
jgi:hypothetical protein